MKSFESVALSLLLFVGAATANSWSVSCDDQTVDPTTQVLSARCNVGDGRGTFADAALDLNECFEYEGGAIVYAPDGRFGQSCGDCATYELPDPVYYDVYGITYPWMDCVCEGKVASVNLGKSPLTNEFGVLKCSDV